jgi:hypothetical protein
MFTAERQRTHPYLERVDGPLYEQWYLLHHRIVRVVTNHRSMADDIRRFLYYAELLADFAYERPADLPSAIPEDLLWQVGERLYFSTPLTCYLFETRPGEAFPPPPAQSKPAETPWMEISGVDGPLRARWQSGPLRYREHQAYPDVTCRVLSVLHKYDYQATIYIENVAECQPWFLTRFVFYMVAGVMLNFSGLEILHAGAVALGEQGMLIAGPPTSGKSTLILSCLEAGLNLLGDDVLLLGRDVRGLHSEVRVYAFPEDIGVRSGASDLLRRSPCMQNLPKDARQKRAVDVQRHFPGQFVGSSPVRLLTFLHPKNRAQTFRAEPLAQAEAVSLLMQEYVAQQQARPGEADFMFDIFNDLAAQAPAYRLWLAPRSRENAEQLQGLLLLHIKDMVHL